MKIPEFGYYMIKEAGTWVTPDDVCAETSENRGECIDRISSYFHNGTIISEPYCTSWVWVVCDKSAISFGEKNKLPKTAGALDLLQKSKAAGFGVDTTPVPGSVFYRKTKALGATGHTGILVKTDSERIYTVEANTPFTIEGKSYEGVWSRYYDKSSLESLGFQFIHTELMFGSDSLIELDYDSASYSNANPFTGDSVTTNGRAAAVVALGLVALGGAHYLYKKGYLNSFTKK